MYSVYELMCDVCKESAYIYFCLVCKHKEEPRLHWQQRVPGEMEKGLIKVKAAVKAAETVMLWLAKVLVFILLPKPVKVGPSLLIR